MNYSILNNQIIIEGQKDFEPRHILDCGQVFRYLKTDSGYKIFSKNLFCSLIYVNDRVIINSINAEYFVNYFDLNRDYGEIKKKLVVYPGLSDAIKFGNGIRILNQDPAEVIISFIISANNNIPRIKLIIERLCTALGEDMGDYHAFPGVDALARAPIELFKSVGTGYRAGYLSDTAKKLADGFSLDFSGLEYGEARKKLMSLKGVGGKVADCILLFGFHRTEAFPTDVWIERVFTELFGESDLSGEKKSKILSAKFGDLSGYAQQYLYYNARENLIK